MNCRGCGVELDPSKEQVNTTVDQIPETSPKDAQKKGGMCPLCRHSKQVAYSYRKTELIGLLLACLILGIIAVINIQRLRETQRAAAKDAVTRMATNGAVVPEYSNTIAAAPRFNGHFPCVFASVTDGRVVPKVGNCAMPTTHGGPIDRFEADLRYGNFVLRETDLFLDDGFKVPLTRTYCSHEWVDRNPVHAFGRNSNHPFDIAPIGNRNPYTYQMIVLEDADFLYFDRISKGTGYADAVFRHTETSTGFYETTTRWDGHGWTTKFADGSEILFPESYNAKNLAQGAAYEMRDASGHRLELHRDPQRNLEEIRTPHGHWIRFSYDDLSRIKRAEDDAGHWVKYEYNPYGMLKSAILSSGRQRHYNYSGVLMTDITDENGHVLIRNWYRERLLEKQQFGNGGVYQYSYDWPQDEYFPRRVGVTLPDGTLRQLSVADSVPQYVRNYRRR